MFQGESADRGGVEASYQSTEERYVQKQLNSAFAQGRLSSLQWATVVSSGSGIQVNRW